MRLAIDEETFSHLPDETRAVARAVVADLDGKDPELILEVMVNLTCMIAASSGHIDETIQGFADCMGACARQSAKARTFLKVGDATH